MACDGPVAAVAWGATWLRFGVFPVSHRKKASVNPATETACGSGFRHRVFFFLDVDTAFIRTAEKQPTENHGIIANKTRSSDNKSVAIVWL